MKIFREQSNITKQTRANIRIIKKANKAKKKSDKKSEKALKKINKSSIKKAKPKKQNFLVRAIKFLFNLVISILLFPFKFVYRFLSNITKRLKFSITFKISASYFLLYLVIILIVTATTSIGYFVYVLNNFKRDVIQEDLYFIEENFPRKQELDELSNRDNIFEIDIFDSNLDIVYSSGDYNRRYSDNIIAVLENLIYSRQYVYSANFYYNNIYDYYVNINYSVANLMEEAYRIMFLIFLSGAFGFVIFIPIVSRTSYKMIRPIKNMTEITKTISVNNINTRLDVKDTQDELKELSNTFNDMMDRIEQGYKTQQQFVSDASHELRTPIAVIKGYVNMLDRWGKNDKAVLEESISAIKNETDSMQDLIEKLLFIARSDKHTLTFSKEDFRISETLNEIEKETHMIDQKHNFIFKFYNDVSIYADKNRIKQAVRIFIENAIKFTPENGHIAITAYIEEEYYIIRISDSGIGIDRKDLGKIFDRLYRTEESRSKEIGGHGLGLSIAKIIILGHKGKIKVRSNLNVGSEFFIMLPYIEDKTIS